MFILFKNFWKIVIETIVAVVRRIFKKPVR